MAGAEVGQDLCEDVANDGATLQDRLLARRRHLPRLGLRARGAPRGTRGRHVHSTALVAVLSEYGLETYSAAVLVPYVVPDVVPVVVVLFIAVDAPGVDAPGAAAAPDQTGQPRRACWHAGGVTPL